VKYLQRFPLRGGTRVTARHNDRYGAGVIAAEEYLPWAIGGLAGRVNISMEESMEDSTGVIVARRGLHDEDEGWEERLFDIPDDEDEDDEGFDDDDLDDDVDDDLDDEDDADLEDLDEDE
jgi:hypothetical protein